MNSANYATYQQERKKMMENFAKGISAFPLDVSISYLKLTLQILPTSTSFTSLMSIISRVTRTAWPLT